MIHLVSMFLFSPLIPAAGHVDFETQIRPLFQEQCVSCHGPTKQKNGLRLDSKSAAFKGGDNGIALAPKKSSESELFRRVTHPDAGKRMPPGKNSLTPAQIELLKRWIDAGADWPETKADREAARDKRLDHWAWQPVVKVPVPNVSDPAIGNDIDRFILAKLREKGLTLAAEADRRTLIRRLSYDLTGLPPSPEAVQAFLSEADPKAYEKLVDRFLASPQYGERWARHWLDIAHYADTHGFERDQRRDHAWRYRDWVIKALNQDQPYDAFLRDQIAGDVIHPNSPDGLTATGFLAAGPWDFVGQAETPSLVLKRLARADDLDDMVTQVLTAACGVTINCARCHDHKLDPISQKEYYQLLSVFAGVKRGNRALSTQEEKEYNAKRAPLEKRLAEIKAKPELKDERDTLQKQLAAIPEPARVYGILSETPPEVKRLHRGNTEDPKETVSPGAIACVSKFKPEFGNTSLGDGERRLAFANWVTHPDNPLTGRVIVNRLWHHHFGAGLVDTPSDFGLGGGLPSHPELLDWLAEKLREEKWSLKAMHRHICLSRAYRQTSIAKGGEKIDGNNRLLWRQNTRRVDAESLRDGVLSISGKLNPVMGGPGYRDFEYKEEYAPVYTYVTADRSELWRRSIYRFVVRTTPQQFLTTLDCPNPANLSPARTVTTTALQSLAMLNDEFMLKQAGYLAARLEKEAGSSREKQIRLAFELALGRPPAAAELKGAESLAAKHGLAQFCRFLLNANEFVTID
ncbi:PSD1 and planctomycete cytochrome C domain-containing protein [Zavarzinella formosa]|uniref:PSD1 and planctomycete cytochrome C domain-containing protein n=1 Tax=Zavarzinella formosa TaxID=360055 RepID=UPI0002F06949|nr:DUF1553 domain-containing protein [Zavarzinella formosa]